MKKTYLRPVLETIEVARDYQLCAGSPNDKDSASVGNGKNDDDFEDEDIEDDEGKINAQSKGWGYIGGFWD